MNSDDKNMVNADSKSSHLSGKGEANLGRLLFDGRTPISLHVCLKPTDQTNELMSSLDPFETISLGVGRRYYLARLSMGKGFYERFILLNVYNKEKDEHALAELAMLEHFGSNDRIPFPEVIDFNRGNNEESEAFSYSPTFYCSKKNYFFNVPCTYCSGKLEAADDGLLYCPRCHELNHKSHVYSYYDAVNESSSKCSNEKIVLLEEVFSEYAQSDQFSSIVPCSGCEHSVECFPQEPKSISTVANELHYIIPFSHEPFSIYGFSYNPLSLVDYCDLVSGKSKSDFLGKLKKNKEFGKYRVLSESTTFAKRFNQQDYLTVKDPDPVSVLSVKLRVFMRICDALSRLNDEVDVSGLSHADINMDVSQMYAAGDSFTRAKIGFVPHSETAADAFITDEEGGVKGIEKVISRALSEILFIMFFNSKQCNELKLIKAVDKLLGKVNKRVELSLANLDEIINSSDVLPAVFLRNNFHNKSISNGGLTSEVNQVVLTLIRLGLILTCRLGDRVFLSEDSNSRSFVYIISELKKMFGLLDLMRTSRLPIESDRQLLETALNEIIDDEVWLKRVLDKQVFKLDENAVVSQNDDDLGENEFSKISAFSKHDSQDVTESDKTVIMSSGKLNLPNADEVSLDKTVLLEGGATENVETDEVMIMSSINRILRQL